MSRLIKVNLLKITWLVSICEYAEKIPSMSNSSSMEISFQTVPRIHKNLKTLFLFLLSLFLFACIHCFVFFWGCYRGERIWGTRKWAKSGCKMWNSQRINKKIKWKTHKQYPLYYYTTSTEAHTKKNCLSFNFTNNN